MDETLGERIKKVRKYYELTQTEFGEKINARTSTIASYETGARTPIASVITFICKEFHVNENWLRSGEGDMFAAESKEEEIAAITAKLFQEPESSFRFKLIKLLAQMDEKQMKQLKAYVETLVQ